MDFASAKYAVADAFAANELYQDNGWTDGLRQEGFCPAYALSESVKA